MRTEQPQKTRFVCTGSPVSFDTGEPVFLRANPHLTFRRYPVEWKQTILGRMTVANLDRLFERLWESFRRLNPQAEQIHQLLSERGEQIVNDHIAFRTFDDRRVDLDVLARPFVSAGYVAKEDYEFPNKHLSARHFEHPEPGRPKIFVSQLKLDDMSEQLRATVTGLIDQIPADAYGRDDFCVSGRLWSLDYSTYEQLARESEYAGWLSAFGFCANHFTVLVNELKTVAGLEELNELLKENGFALNTSGGEIKGSPAEYLEQSSTLAAQIDVPFSDGVHRIPSCYYEFARRYEQPDGRLFTGFIAQSADKIFESTDRRE